MAIEALNGTGAMPYQGGSTETTTKSENRIEPVRASIQTVETQRVNADLQSESNTENDKQQDSQRGNGQIKSAVSQANSRMKHARTRCEFDYHEETKRISIKIFDKDTDEVIREVPAEETLEMVQKMWELAGILVDEKR